MNKKLILLAFIIVVSISFSFNAQISGYSNLNLNKLNQICSDTDGIDYSIQGFTSNELKSFSDTCNGYQVTEYACELSEVTSTKHECTFECNKGACEGYRKHGIPFELADDFKFISENEFSPNQIAKEQLIFQGRFRLLPFYGYIESMSEIKYANDADQIRLLVFRLDDTSHRSEFINGQKEVGLYRFLYKDNLLLVIDGAEPNRQKAFNKLSTTWIALN